MTALRDQATPALVLLLLGFGAMSASAQTRDRGRIAAAVDSIVADALKDQRAAGMSVAVVRGRDTLVMKGYGYADVELDVPTPDRAVYEIGSVTKQFTAAAILQLADQGKLSLDDDVTKYLPDYSTQGHRIPLRRLMDHTSGIKGYTEMPEFGRMGKLALARDTLVAAFAAAPFDFSPGDALIYNNSAYFLLGLVIEKVTGSSYEDYVEKSLFQPAGMADSRYCSNTEVVKRRAHGYSRTPEGLRRAEYLDHTWPYAAGSLCSTVGDLIAWNQALHGGRILSPSSYRALITAERLNDGTPVRYAKGIAVDSLHGQRTLHHGGGIPGFLSELDYFPDDTLSIAVLVNTTGPVNPGAISHSIARLIMGSGPELAEVPFRGSPADYAGEYRGAGRGTEMTVKIEAAEGGGLAAQMGSGPMSPIVYVGGETFQRGSTRFIFERKDGAIVRLRVDSVGGYMFLERRP